MKHNAIFRSELALPSSPRTEWAGDTEFWVSSQDFPTKSTNRTGRLMKPVRATEQGEQKGVEGSGQFTGTLSLSGRVLQVPAVRAGRKEYYVARCVWLLSRFFPSWNSVRLSLRGDTNIHFTSVEMSTLDPRITSIKEARRVLLPSRLGLAEPKMLGTNSRNGMIHNTQNSLRRALDTDPPGCLTVC